MNSNVHNAFRFLNRTIFVCVCVQMINYLLLDYNWRMFFFSFMNHDLHSKTLYAYVTYPWLCGWCINAIWFMLKELSTCIIVHFVSHINSLYDLKLYKWSKSSKFIPNQLRNVFVPIYFDSQKRMTNKLLTIRWPAYF